MANSEMTLWVSWTPEEGFAIEAGSVFQPKVGDIVREKKYAQPLEVIAVAVQGSLSIAETKPAGSPSAPSKWRNFKDLQPYRNE